jgi:predicted MFS family arabinose efflux permease
MPTTPDVTQLRPGRFEQIATRITFFVVGFSFASWAPVVPLVRTRIGLDTGQLGSLLLCLGLGAFAGMPISGGLAARFGCRAVILVSGAVALISLPLVETAASSAVLAGGLLAFGAAVGTMDVVMNIQAVIVEKAAGRAMMSGFHGHYSVGGIAGAGAMTGLLLLGIPVFAAVLTIVAISALLLTIAAKGLLPFGSEGEARAFAVPRGRVLLIGALCFVMFLAEGSVLDWSGVLLNVVRRVDKSEAGLGYVAFSITMTAGRLLGDGIVRRLGPKAVLLLGGSLCAGGFGLAALVPAWPVSILGFAIVGAGASNNVPVLFSAAGRQTSMPSNMAIAAVTSMGYAGLLAGPALIGFVARAFTLPVSLLMVAAMVGTVVLSAKRVTAGA